MAEPYATLDEVKDSEQKDEDALLLAASLVQQWAPVPDPLPEDYADLAAVSERAVARQIIATGGYITSKSLSGVTSKSFDLSLKTLKGLVRANMGVYYTGGQKALNIV